MIGAFLRVGSDILLSRFQGCKCDHQLYSFCNGYVMRALNHFRGPCKNVYLQLQSSTSRRAKNNHHATASSFFQSHLGQRSAKSTSRQEVDNLEMTESGLSQKNEALPSRIYVPTAAIPRRKPSFLTALAHLPHLVPPKNQHYGRFGPSGNEPDEGRPSEAPQPTVRNILAHGGQSSRH